MFPMLRYGLKAVYRTMILVDNIILSVKARIISEPEKIVYPLPTRLESSQSWLDSDSSSRIAVPSPSCISCNKIFGYETSVRCRVSEACAARWYPALCKGKSSSFISPGGRYKTVLFSWIASRLFNPLGEESLWNIVRTDGFRQTRNAYNWSIILYSWEWIAGFDTISILHIQTILYPRYVATNSGTSILHRAEIAQGRFVVFPALSLPREQFRLWQITDKENSHATFVGGTILLDQRLVLGKD